MKVEVRRITLRVGFIVAGLLVLVAAGIAVKLLKSGNYLLWATGSNDKAFLGTTWMMSPNEVERATQSPLAIQEDLPLFVPDLVRKKRFTAAAQRGTHQLFGHPIDVTYVFFDHLLYAYALDLRVSSIDKVPEIRNALQTRFGTPDRSAKKDHAAASDCSKQDLTDEIDKILCVARELEGPLIEDIEWSAGKQTVSFRVWGPGKDPWPRYSILVSAKYSPLQSEIEAIVAKEKTRYF